MLADPQGITLDTIPIVLNRTKVGDENCTYRSSDGAIQLRTSHQSGKGRTRRMIRIDHKVVAADPITAVNQLVSAGIYVVFDIPTNLSYSNVNLLLLWSAFTAYLTANSSAVVQKVAAGES